MPARSQAQHYRLHAGNRRVLGVLLADAPRHHRRCGQGDAQPMANTSASSDSVMPTVATALAPRLPTQNTSVTANSDSSTISSTIGMASRKMARFRFRSCSPGASRAEPRVPTARSRGRRQIGQPREPFKTDIAIAPRCARKGTANGEGATLRSDCDLQIDPRSEVDLGAEEGKTRGNVQRLIRTTVG